ncbi:MAG TPA: hypothetical protein VFS09_05560 [Candidatus Eisenbacteria bacterium]|nr:hypothetical protein [Candidatus Eisenbacteria bacterium]
MGARLIHVTRRPAKRPARAILVAAAFVALAVAAARARGQAEVLTRTEEPRPCPPPSDLPAYSHNDERRGRALEEALRLGYAGVEVDLHYRGGKLLVGHDLEETRPGRTFESCYLAPLAAIAKRCGGIRQGGAPLLLLVDLKTKGMPGYRALCAALAAESALVTRYRLGGEAPTAIGPVTVLLVGWIPPLDSLRAEEVRYVSAHRPLGTGDRAGKTSSGPEALDRLETMVSLDASKLPRWSGTGAAPRAWDVAFEGMRKAAAGPGLLMRIARVHHLPVNARVYEYALSRGADLIGTEALEASRPLLLSGRPLPGKRSDQ